MQNLMKTFLCLRQTLKIYTLILEDAINSIKELVIEFSEVFPNAEFIVELLNIILKNSLMTFNGEYFQTNFWSNNGNKCCAHFSEYLFG